MGNNLSGIIVIILHIDYLIGFNVLKVIKCLQDICNWMLYSKESITLSDRDISFT